MSAPHVWAFKSNHLTPFYVVATPYGKSAAVVDDFGCLVLVNVE